MHVETFVYTYTCFRTSVRPSLLVQLTLIILNKIRYDLYFRDKKFDIIKKCWIHSYIQFNLIQLCEKVCMHVSVCVYFLDGNKRVFYNYHSVYDAESKKVIINDKSSLNKLYNLLLHKYAGKYKTAIIYHKETNKQIKQ